MIRLFILFFFCFFLTLITAEAQQDLSSSDPIAVETFIEQEDFISTIAVVGDWLFAIRSFQLQENLLHAFDVRTGEQVFAFIRPGRGPGEYFNFTIRRGPEPNQLEIVDKGAFKNDIYDTACLKEKPPISRTHTCIVKTVNNYSSNVDAILLDNGLVFNHSMSGEGSLFLSRGEQHMKTLLGIPEEIGRMFSRPTLASMAISGRLVASPDRSRVAFFADAYDQFMIFGRNGDSLEQVMSSNYNWLPEFEVEDFGSSGLLRPSQNTRIAFKSVDAGNSYIYALYSGKAEADFTDNERREGSNRIYYSDRVKVYDWDGNEIKEIKLGKEVYQIAVDYDETTLYGVYAENEEWGIIRASLD